MIGSGLTGFRGLSTYNAAAGVSKRHQLKTLAGGRPCSYPENRCRACSCASRFGDVNASPGPPTRSTGRRRGAIFVDYGALTLLSATSVE